MAVPLALAARPVVGRARPASRARPHRQPPAMLPRSAIAGHWGGPTELALAVAAATAAPAPARAPARSVVRMGNAATGGPFSPLVRVVRNAMGVKEFNLLRGKAISLHSQVIKEFCKSIGADTKQVQGLIRLAKKNGEKLGFLA